MKTRHCIVLLACALLLAVPAVAEEPETREDGPNVAVTMTLTKDGASRAYRAVCPGNGGRVRVSDGVRTPIPATAFNTSNTVGSSMVPVVSFTYQVVGFEAELRARVLPDGRVGLDGRIEDSRLAGYFEYEDRFKNPEIGFYGYDFEQVSLTPGVPMATTVYGDGGGSPLTIEIVATIQGE